MFWLRILLHFAFSLFVVSIFPMESSAPDIFYSISCILLLMLASMVPDFFPRVSISSVASLWVFFLCLLPFLRLLWFCSFPSQGCFDLEPEKGAASEALWLLPVPEAVSFCSPHSHLCILVLVESQKQDQSWCFVQE
jgi:hypothetical protein